MTTRLILIAQGATTAVRRAAFASDEPLDPTALHSLAETDPLRWQGRPAFVSPMLASRQTAEALGLMGAVDAGLADLSAGQWAGRTIAEIAAEHPIDLAQWIADAGFDRHGGESRRALRNRAGRWLVDHAGAGLVLAVTHPAVIRAMVLAVLDGPDDSFWRLDIAPLTATDLRHDGRRWALRGLGLPLVSTGWDAEG